jgi:hypothetical protein
MNTRKENVKEIEVEVDEDSDDYDEVRDEYYAQCGWRFIAMITEEEYNKLNAEGEWCA